MTNLRKEAEKKFKEEKEKLVVERIVGLLKLKELKQKELDDTIKSLNEVTKKGLNGVTIKKEEGSALTTSASGDMSKSLEIVGFDINV